MKKIKAAKRRRRDDAGMRMRVRHVRATCMGDMRVNAPETRVARAFDRRRRRLPTTPRRLTEQRALSGERHFSWREKDDPLH
jgi:hypothetical protein